MNLTTDFLVKAVARALRDDVLPALETKSPAAGNLRACLMLLASIEDRVRSEGPALFDTNTKLRDAFRRMSTSPAMRHEPELAQGIAAALAAFPAHPGFVAVADLYRENLAYQEILCRVIARAHERRSVWGPEAYRGINREIAGCTDAIGKLDETFVQHARDLTPL
jgi:hypothetical protein